ncbi:MAG TPA: cyanophycinase [Bacillota bacterium]|nr:cyanophycinase [Bacillota bacterium]
MLVIVGGGEAKEGEAPILARVVDLAGGRGSRILVCTVASEEPEAAAAPYLEAFPRLGAAQAQALHVPDRAAACSLEALRQLRAATAVYFVGGDQIRITALIGGTPLERVLRRRFAEGLLVAGTSAGASAVSSTMVVGGEAEVAPQMNAIRLAPGLGLLPGVVVDQHFAQRGRIGRLLAALACNPRPLALGLDEDTAAVVQDGSLQVLGSGAVTICDGRRSVFTNVSDTAPGQPLALAGVSLHVLPSGYGFDLRRRRPLRPGAADRRAPSGGRPLADP